jgi:hypothetical protein
MKKWSAVALLVGSCFGALLMGSGVARGETPPEAGVYFETCEEVRGNATEYDRCIGNELSKQRAIAAKNDELNLDRCNEFLVPFNRIKFEHCAVEEFNKFPEYGPEALQQYLDGEPWSWPDKSPPWWEDDYVPVTTPEAAEEFHRWWEGDFYITAQPSPDLGDKPTWQNNWTSHRAPLVGDWAPPEW